MLIKRSEQILGISEKLLEDVVFNLMKYASIELPKDVINNLRKCYENEDTLIAKSQLESIFKSIEISQEQQIGLCQDTGIPAVYMDLGLNCKLENDPVSAITRAIARATKEVPLRQNVINPLTKKNSGTNTGWGMPYIHWDVISGADFVEVMAVPKGFGSEIRATQCWVLTSEDISRGALKAVLDVVEDSMGEPCPPLIVGVGIGGFADTSMALAKKALFREPIGSNHPDPIVADLENEILEAVNEIGLGPMGVGGKTYALGVHAEICGSHTAVIPITVMFQCWACRYSKARIYNDGTVEYITHPEGGKK